MRSARRRAREFALQGLYAWQTARTPAREILADLSETRDFPRADRDYLDRLLLGAIEMSEILRGDLVPLLDRKWDELSPVERGILLLAGFELKCFPEVPYRVVINEAIELAKLYGGTDGHKYVNGVLDRMAKALRPLESGR
jgi:transcription antitermination protein NusB